MHTAIEIATDLRALADHYEKLGDIKLPKPRLVFHGEDKSQFVACSQALPRPIEKVYPTRDGDYESVRFYHHLRSLDVESWAWRVVACRVVEPPKPAVYECDPILSETEEAEITA